MIVKKHIEGLLKELEEYYNSCSGIRSTLYSKLAVIELCGWIEQSFDLIAKRCLKGKIKTQPYNQIFTYGIIQKNFGFDYKKNFRKMMLSSIGVIQTEKLEINLTRTGEIFVLTSTLETLKIERDRAAHTTSAGVAVTYQAPSVTLQQFRDIYPIVRKMYSFAIKYNKEN